MKYKIIIFCFIVIFLTTWMAGSVSVITSGGLGNDVPTQVDPTVDGLVSFLTVYWGLLSFQLLGVPWFISVIFLITNMVFLILIVMEVILPMLQSNPWTLLVGLIAAALTAFIAWIGSLGINFEDIGNTIGSWFDWGWW